MISAYADDILLSQDDIQTPFGLWKNFVFVHTHLSNTRSVQMISCFRKTISKLRLDCGEILFFYTSTIKHTKCALVIFALFKLKSILSSACTHLSYTRSVLLQERNDVFDFVEGVVRLDF